MGHGERGNRCHNRGTYDGGMSSVDLCDPRDAHGSRRSSRDLCPLHQSGPFPCFLCIFSHNEKGGLSPGGSGVALFPWHEYRGFLFDRNAVFNAGFRIVEYGLASFYTIR